jgi:ABC-2 type transport system permease protein
MAWLFVRLKLALLLNGFRRGWQQALGIVFGALYILPLAIAGFFGAIALGRSATLAPLAEPVLVLVFALLWLVWTLGPLIAFGMDETLNPARLRLLPLRRHQLMGGLFAASAVGIGPLATLVFLGGVAVGFASDGLAALIVVPAVLAEFALCIASGRAVTTALSRRLQSRRGRDILTLGAALFGVVFVGLAQLPRLMTSAPEQLPVTALVGPLTTVATTASVLPPAWAARAVAAGHQGSAGVGILWLLAALGGVAAALWWWSRSLERTFDAPRAEASATDAADLFPRALTWLPRTRLGAGIAKDVRYAWRVPQVRAQYLVLTVMFIPGAVFLARSSPDPRVVLLAPVLAMLTGTASFNLFGPDRGAVWLLDTTGPQPRTDLVAKSLVAMGLGLLTTLTVAVLLAATSAGWDYLVPAALLAAATVAVVAAIGAVVSVVAPFPMPDSPTNVFAANAGVGCAAVMIQGLGMIGEFILLAPVVAGVLLTVRTGPAALVAVAAAAVVYGGLIWWLGTGIAARRLARRGPEFITALQAGS